MNRDTYVVSVPQLPEVTRGRMTAFIKNSLTQARGELHKKGAVKVYAEPREDYKVRGARMIGRLVHAVILAGLR